MQNRLVDRFTGGRRDGCLNEHLFTSYRHAQAIIKDRRIDYHAKRPHTSLYAPDTHGVCNPVLSGA